jgi:hypothetical protein
MRKGVNESYILLFTDLLNNYCVNNLYVQTIYGTREKGQLVTEPRYLKNVFSLN